MRSFVLLLFALSVFPLSSSAQSRDELKDIFTQAESYFIYEEYELANPLYIMIEGQGNMNLKYKIGTCYLNIAGEKGNSIPYLEEAVTSASNNSNPESFKEIKAPSDAYFSLAKAYMINQEFEKAISTFLKFKELAKEPGLENRISNFEYVDQLIMACRNAISFRQVPVSFEKTPLWNNSLVGAVIENPAVSYDENSIVYTERRGIENAIFFSQKVNGQWDPPVEITDVLNAGKDCSTCSLNSDGTELFLYKIEDYDGSIYSSKKINGVWTTVKKLNKNINTKYYESHASVSSDGKRLYFASNREGGFGNLDIYVSERNGNGDWGSARNLGPVINTAFNEDSPFITENDSILYFDSEGHNSMGGFDIFRSRRKGTDWESPSNLGYPVNSSDDDKFFQPANNGKNAFYSITTDYKKKGIFYLSFPERLTGLNYEITGKLTLNDSANIIDKAGSLVEVINRVSGDTILKASPDEFTGYYSIKVPSGLYSIFYSCPGYLSHTLDTLIVASDNKLAKNFDVVLTPDIKKPSVKGGSIEKINLAIIPEVASIDSSILITNLILKDESDKIKNTEILYYTVQVMALHKPVDVSYFKFIHDMKVIYNDTDKFYRYTSGRFDSKEEAYIYRNTLMNKGYPDQIFVKKVVSNQDKK